MIDVEGFIVRLAFSRLVDQKRIGDLEMAKRISNSFDLVVKSFQSVFVKKIIRKYFRKQKISTEIAGPEKNFKKIRTQPIFKKCYTKVYAIMTGLRIFPVDSKTSRVSTGRLVSSTLQTTSSAMIEYPYRETKRVIVFDNERTYVPDLIS